MKLVSVAVMVGIALVTSAATRPLRSHEHRIERNNLKLALYEKWQAGNENTWKKNGKVILLIHGATWSSRCTFDPTPEYSLMDTLARAGYDVFALDLHGYGKSDVNEGAKEGDWSDAASTMADVDATMDYIRALRWVDQVNLFGYQWGAQVAALYAVAKPAKVGRLALFAMRYHAVDKRPAPTEKMRANNVQSATLRQEEGDFDPAFSSLRAEACARWDASSPNGALLDLANPSPVEPGRLAVPTLLLAGERDADPAVVNDRLDFFAALATPEKWMIVVPLVGKQAFFERDHARVESVLLRFLER